MSKWRQKGRIVLCMLVGVVAQLASETGGSYNGS
jgi:hypothetical protein